MSKISFVIFCLPWVLSLLLICPGGGFPDLPEQNSVSSNETPKVSSGFPSRASWHRHLPQHPVACAKHCPTGLFPWSRRLCETNGIIGETSPLLLSWLFDLPRPPCKSSLLLWNSSSLLCQESLPRSQLPPLSATAAFFIEDKFFYFLYNSSDDTDTWFLTRPIVSVQPLITLCAWTSTCSPS